MSFISQAESGRMAQMILWYLLPGFLAFEAQLLAKTDPQNGTEAIRLPNLLTVGVGKGYSRFSVI